MKIKYTLYQGYMAYILLISLLLQSCNHNHLTHSLVTLKAREQEEARQALVKEDLFTEEDPGCVAVPVGPAISQEELGEEAKWESEKLSKNKRKTESYQVYALGDLKLIPIELVEKILSYVGSKDMGQVRQLNKSFYKLTTGYKHCGLVGVNNKPTSDCLKLAVNTRTVDFERCNVTPATIPSLPFFKLVGSVKSLPQTFWPYLQDTQVHIVNLAWNRIGAAGAEKFAQALQGTQVHTLDLWDNGIGDAGVAALAQALPHTHVHTLNLGYNNIGDGGASTLATVLPGTQVHTLNLAGNQIGDSGAIELATTLPGTQVHTLILNGNWNYNYNYIGAAGASALAEALPHTQVHTLHLRYNQIGDLGAQELAQALPLTQVHTLDLRDNQIGDAGAIALATAFLPGTQVHTLDLRNNQIGDVGAIALATAFLSGTQVHTLDLRNNQIGFDAARLLEREHSSIAWYFC